MREQVDRYKDQYETALAELTSENTKKLEVYWITNVISIIEIELKQ